MKKYGIWMLCFIWGCSDSSTGPESPTPQPDFYSVFGTIKNGYENPIVGAQVRVGDTIVTTDSAGLYEISSLLSGSYFLTVAKEGYDTLENHQISIGEGNVEKNILLKRVWSIELPVYDSLVRLLYIQSMGFFHGGDNFGTSPILKIGYDDLPESHNASYEQWYSYVGFDFAAVPQGSELRGAVLSMFRAGGGAIEIDMWQVLGPWNEYGITFNNRPSVQATSLLPAAINISPSQSGFSVNLTDYVASVLQGRQLPYGIFLQGDICTFYSRENQDSTGPTLVVDFYF